MSDADMFDTVTGELPVPVPNGGAVARAALESARLERADRFERRYEKIIGPPSLNKKIRTLGLKMALSAKAKDGKLIVLDTLAGEGKTKALAAQLGTRFGKTALVIDGGVTAETAPLVAAAGANALVAGSATFKGGPGAYAANMAAIREAAEKAR